MQITKNATPYKEVKLHERVVSDKVSSFKLEGWVESTILAKMRTNSARFQS